MSKAKTFIWVDDERPIPKNLMWLGEEKVVCRTYRQAIKALKTYCYQGNVFLSLDHDLGQKKTGYDIAKYIVENKIPLYGFVCHSMNPVGRSNIEDLLCHYGYFLGCK